MGRIKMIISIIVGGILFAGFFNDRAGLFVGMALGFLLVRTSTQKKLLQGMEKRLKEYEILLNTLSSKTTSTTSPLSKESTHPTLPEAKSRRPPSYTEARVETAASSRIASPPREVSFEVAEEEKIKGQSPPSSASPVFPNHPDWTERLAAYLRDFFTQGNVVLRVGLLVLFFGVAFLLKYAVERNMLSIELRLLGVALGGIVMLLLGWRQRLQRRGFALLMQGGGIGLLFLDVFAAFK
ncbi:MAG: DUF2339 domain-containing protein, partial [Candidatus Electrothrix sp. AUS4]|nr:DUF2339 domain-containing protein [Candidatus Electrothrix sp. AUS4]